MFIFGGPRVLVCCSLSSFNIQDNLPFLHPPWLKGYHFYWTVPGGRYSSLPLDTEKGSGWGKKKNKGSDFFFCNDWIMIISSELFCGASTAPALEVESSSRTIEKILPIAKVLQRFLLSLMETCIHLRLQRNDLPILQCNVCRAALGPVKRDSLPFAPWGIQRSGYQAPGMHGVV